MFQFKVITVLVTVGIASLALAAAAGAATTHEERVRAELRELRADPIAFMKRRPTRLDRMGRRVPLSATVFTKGAVLDRSFVATKLKFRESRFETPFHSGYHENDRPDRLVDELAHATLRGIESAGLTSAMLDESPWSDDYWPIYAGSIAKRYMTDGVMSSRDWRKNYEKFVESTPATAIEFLSPAEKYDLLVGDAKQTLTRAMWDEGKRLYDSYGKVESWMGLCHGWAAASYMVPRPARSIEVLAADGRTVIPFYPSDIKALTTLQWANGRVRTRFLGGRCNVKDPATDENGRIIDQDCFDTNPAAWHLAIVNQLGHSKRSFVLDATFDYQVWNQPVVSYRYSYFNPGTNQRAQSLPEASVRLSELRPDRFSAYRAKGAAFVVGIAMEVTYVVENRPVRTLLDLPQYDNHFTVSYLYDLELDGRGRIVGGEWYQNKHPDFLWTPARGARARSAIDLELTRRGLDGETWDGSSPLPSSWREPAVLAARRGEPLALIVERLVGLSRIPD